MATATDFGYGGDYEFAVGSVFGTRSWKVGGDGRLYGIVHDQVAWDPKVAYAHCERGFRYFPVAGTPPFVGATHDMRTCFCGFYGYFSGQHNDYASCIWTWGLPTVTGVVEAYGKTVLGTKGFRAEKARIVALCLPEYHDPTADLKASRLAQHIELRTDWNRGTLFEPYGAGGIFAAVVSVCATGLAVIAPWVIPLLVAVFVAGVYTAWSSFKAIDYHYDKMIALAYSGPDYTDVFEKVRVAYPNAKVYTTEAEMYRNHPLTPPPELE